MYDYRKSDYAINKNSPNIVYRFHNEILEITLEDYLKENSTTPIRLSLSRKSLTRCRRSASSATEGQKPERVACSPAWFTVLTAGQRCATAPPTILRSGKTILYAPATAATQEPVQPISSGRLYWKNWSGCT